MPETTQTFEEAYQEQYSDLVRYIDKIINNWEVAEEIAQETMLKAWQVWNEIHFKLLPWLRLVAKREAIDFLRRQNLIMWYSLIDIDVERSVNLQEMIALGDMINHLSPSYQKAIKLAIVGYSHQDAIDPVRSKYTLARARKRLKEIYHAD